jgi:hypothetical protein
MPVPAPFILFFERRVALADCSQRMRSILKGPLNSITGRTFSRPWETHAELILVNLSAVLSTSRDHLIPNGGTT